MDVHGEFDTIEPLQATGDPFDPFALQKACLLCKAAGLSLGAQQEGRCRKQQYADRTDFQQH